ncbi:carbonic anhydrase [Bacillus cytotoxicus]|uniref:Carbonic anhydrase n=1 Tax=Bacillus cytotoxicus (strain DSM 22905 / CIP 110041 / 391-98 / NVH 391-98) TaxID=315749 RepID=A7GMS6_BACCN|nr:MULTISPECIES: carbonic anhydrase [Bacillus cereus group]ABS21434.1 carbonic anhydrase [Bacillus cytotoxicus NVH 391-98]AWC28075.1 carbonic anhydrase [Bacillus cytotoxicus]AWC32110.1 carbonic anhydrase [Bacillus cytotoxicus]AWC40543.1 carbonic anhydrase [Bacillus cytotoxicus]AWC44142.1 carbonic anhydrase [Bacillus cytotoxicus]
MQLENKKVLLLTDIADGIERMIQQVINVQPENMLTIQSYGSIIVHPYGDIMRSIIIAIYQENVEEIFVVGIKDKETAPVNIQSQLDSIKDNMQLDYLFQHCMPEFSGGTFDDWLNGKGNVSENIEKSIDIIRHHPLIPSDIKIHGFMIHKMGKRADVVNVLTNKTV